VPVAQALDLLRRVFKAKKRRRDQCRPVQLHNARQHWLAWEMTTKPAQVGRYVKQEAKPIGVFNARQDSRHGAAFLRQTGVVDSTYTIRKVLRRKRPYRAQLLVENFGTGVAQYLVALHTEDDIGMRGTIARARAASRATGQQRMRAKKLLQVKIPHRKRCSDSCTTDGR